MLELACGAALGALATWHAQKLRACLEQRAAEAKLRPAKLDPYPPDGAGGEEAAHPPREKLSAEAEALEPFSPELTPQSCADDAAGPPGLRDVAAGAGAAAAAGPASRGRSPLSLEFAQRGTPVAAAAAEQPEEQEQEEAEEDEASAVASLEGRHAAELGAVSNPTEHFCIASFIGSEGSLDNSPGPAACSAEDAGRGASDTVDGSGGVGAGSFHHSEAFRPPPALAARISGRHGKFYAIELSGTTRAAMTWKLHRRYSEFAALDQQVRHKFAGLPELPRKSTFSKRFNPGFLPRRQQGLEAFLTALVAADPILEEPAVRAFVDPEVQLLREAGKANTGTATTSWVSSRTASSCRVPGPRV